MFLKFYNFDLFIMKINNRQNKHKQNNTKFIFWIFELLICLKFENLSVWLFFCICLTFESLDVFVLFWFYVWMTLCFFWWGVFWTIEQHFCLRKVWNFEEKHMKLKKNERTQISVFLYKIENLKIKKTEWTKQKHNN